VRQALARLVADVYSSKLRTIEATDLEGRLAKLENLIAGLNEEFKGVEAPPMPL